MFWSLKQATTLLNQILAKLGYLVQFSIKRKRDCLQPGSATCIRLLSKLTEFTFHYQLAK